MKRLLIFSAAAVAAAAVAVPAVAGLAGNPSFSHKPPVHVPSQAQLVQFDDHGRAVRTTTPSTPGDDHRRPGPARITEPGDDRGHATEPGDDRGGDRVTREPEPGDDRGRPATEPGDDRGGDRTLTSLLATAADVDVVGEAADGAQALEEVAATNPDVVLTDLSMPVMDGVAATRALRTGHPDTRVVVLSSFSDRSRVREAVAAGATGYVLKDCTPDELLAAVRSAADGHAPLDPRVAGALLPGRDAASPAEQLSGRERQVLRLAGKGLANKQIGRELGISERTVKVHLGNVFRRIGVADRTPAALWAREHLDDLGVSLKSRSLRSRAST
ncbi:MAG TPA: response regulator transcription factor [Jatrophihabitantaceae bacterium]